MAHVELERYAGLLSDYTELRVQENRALSVVVVDGDVVRNTRQSAGGVSARACRHGLWGLASNPVVTPDSIAEAVRAATDNAGFLAERLKGKSANLPGRPGKVMRDLTTGKKRSTQKEIIDFARGVDELIVSRFSRVVSRTTVFHLLDMEKTLLTSDGSSGFSMIPRSILYVEMTAIHDDGDPVELAEVVGGLGQFEDVFKSPQALGDRLEAAYEHLMKKAEGVHPETGMHPCILDANLAGILAHEAIGHTTEADCVRGGSVAGDLVGTQVASPLVTLVDYAGEALGRPCPVPVYMDDEGVMAEDVVIIEKGVLKGFLHNRESALHFGTEPTGNARAYGFDDVPLIRMRNTAIVPGTGKLADMIASIDRGYYLMRHGSGQADSTSEFMFGVVLGYEIRNGRIERGIRDTTISGVAFDMLKTVTAVSDEMKWSCGGMCGKKQGIPVGMGGPALKCMISIGGK